LQSAWMTEPMGAPIRLYQRTAMGRQRLADWNKDIDRRVASLKGVLDLYSQCQDSDTYAGEPT
jgi:DNA-binding PadR family transcriptional regulator